MPLTLLAPLPIAGALVTASVDGAVPGETVHLLVARGAPSPGPCPARLGGACLGLVHAAIAGKAVADAAGHATFSIHLADGLLEGDVLGWQAVAVRTGAPSEVSTAVATAAASPVVPTFAGNFTDGWGTWQHVNALTWDDAWGNRFWLTQGDRDTWVVAANDAANAYFPKAWSRFDLTTDALGTLHYCQSAYAASTEALAVATPPADPADLATGCGGFAWTAMTLDPHPLTGVWVDSWGTTNTISDTRWEDSWGNGFTWLDRDDLAGWGVALNDAGNDFFPGLYSTFEWTWDGDVPYVCQSTYDAASEQRARTAPRADPADLVAGCDGFGWTRMAP